MCGEHQRTFGGCCLVQVVTAVVFCFTPTLDQSLGCQVDNVGQASREWLMIYLNGMRQFAY